MTTEFKMGLALMCCIGGHAHWRFARNPGGWWTQISAWAYVLTWVVVMLPGGGPDYRAAVRDNPSIHTTFLALGAAGLILVLAGIFLLYRKSSHLHARWIWFMHAATCLGLIQTELFFLLLRASHGAAA